MTKNTPSGSIVIRKSDELFTLALTQHKAGDADKAKETYEACLKANPRNDDAWNNLGTLLRARKNFEAAVICYKRALDIKPDRQSTINNLSHCYGDMDMEEDALAMCALAEKSTQDDFTTQWNYGMQYREFGRHAEALARFERAAALNPAHIESQWGCALSHLHLGDFEKGWPAFEIRWRLPDLADTQKLPWPRWQGEDLEGKTIYIHEEQGFGDSILASRYIPLVKERGARIILRCKPALHDLFRMPCVDRLFDTGVMDERVDFQVPMMSLPGIFKTTIKKIPKPAPLRPAAAAPAAAQALLDAAGDRFKIGIVWSGSIGFKGNLKRAVHAERFLPLADIPGVQLFSLQKGTREADLDECGGRGIVWELGPHLNNFAETAAVVKKLDLIIMTDSAVAHLAGSLGVKVWNLLNYSPYWIYGSKGATTPWYPSMRLIRQPRPGDWDSVFSEAGDMIRKSLSVV